MEQHFNINGKQFDSVGNIRINNHTYIVTENNGEMVLIEAILGSNGYSYVIPNTNEVDPQRFKGIMFASEIIKNIKQDIDSGIITSKEDLQKRIATSANILETDVNLNTSLQNQGIDDFKANLKEIYSYFDEKVKVALDVDLSNYASREVDGKEYFIDKNDQSRVLENNSDKSLNQQMNNEINDSLINNESVKEDEAYSNLVNSHKEVEMNNINTIDVSKIGSNSLTGNNLVGFELAKGMNDDQNSLSSQVTGNVETGLYLDNQGNIINTSNANNDVVLNKGGEKNAQTSDVSSVSQIASTSNNPDNPFGIDPDKVSIDEIDTLLEHKDEIKPEIVNYLVELRNKKLQELNGNQMGGISNGKVKKLIPPTSTGIPGMEEEQTYFQDNRAAYVNLIVLCLFVQVFMLLIIVGAIFIMK